MKASKIYIQSKIIHFLLYLRCERIIFNNKNNNFHLRTRFIHIKVFVSYTLINPLTVKEFDKLMSYV